MRVKPPAARGMRRIVEHGYETIDYAGAFRTSLALGKIEGHFLRRLVKLLGSKGRVLDFGCGSGIPFDRFVVRQGLKVTGIDLSRKHISLARRNVPGARYIQGDFSRVEPPAKNYDAVISFYAVYHIPRREHRALFQRIHGLLRPGGLLLATLGASPQHCGIEPDWFGAPMVWSSYSPPTYERMLRALGFTLIETAFEGDPDEKEYHYWVLARKDSNPGVGTTDEHR